MPQLRLLCNQINFSFFLKLFKKLRQGLKWDTVTNQQNKLLKVCVYVFVCMSVCVGMSEWAYLLINLPSDTMQPRALRASQSIFWCRVRVGGKRHAEEWCHLAPSALRVEKSRSSHLQLNFSVLWPTYYISSGAVLLTVKSLHSIQDFPHSGLYLLFLK